MPVQEALAEASGGSQGCRDAFSLTGCVRGEDGLGMQLGISCLPALRLGFQGRGPEESR